MAVFTGKTTITNGGANDKSILNSFYSFPNTAGNIRFVYAGATGTGTGVSPTDAFTTIDAAIGACTADNGDVIVVLPGHTEALTAAASVALDVAGVTIRGLGVGRQRPILTYTTAAAASFDISAARCVVENIVFTLVGVDAITAGINVSAADVTIRDCEIELADATNQATLGILTTASANRLIVEGCFFHGTNNAGTATAIRVVGGTDAIFRNNIITGGFTTTLGGIQNVTTAAVNMQIHGNVIVNQTASASVAITLHASTTCIFSNNRLGVLTGTAPVVAAAGTNGGGNYYSAAAGVTAATLI